MKALDLYERATALIEQLFEAPAQPQAWWRFLGALCREMSTDAIAILVGQVVPGGPAMMLCHGVDLRKVPIDSLLPIGPQPSESAVPLFSVVAIPAASEGFASTNLFQNVLSKEGMPPGPGFSVVIARDPEQITGALLVLSRDPSWQASADDRALLELLAPYVRRAVVVGLSLNQRSTDVEMLLGVFDALALGVVLLDRKSRVSFANRSAAEILGTTAGAAPPAGGDPEESRDLRTAALRTLLRSQALGTQSAALAYPHPEDGRPLQIVSTPLRWPDATRGDRRALHDGPVPRRTRACRARPGRGAHGALRAHPRRGGPHEPARRPARRWPRPPRSSRSA